MEAVCLWNALFPLSYQIFIPNPVLVFGKTMPTQPPAPDLLPQYIAEGVPKQDDQSLHALRNWIDNLLAYRQDVAAEDIDASDGETIEAIDKSSDGTVVIKKVSCGKENCRCQSGSLHGPYRYIVTRHGDSLSWEYKGPVSD